MSTPPTPQNSVPDPGSGHDAGSSEPDHEVHDSEVQDHVHDQNHVHDQDHDVHDQNHDLHDHRSQERDLVDISAVEVISRAAVMLMSAAAEQLGLGAEDADDPEHRDLDEARTLITALAGLLRASLPDLGPHAAAFRDGLQALQGAFREYSIVPDEPGAGPGESLGRRGG